MTASAIFRFYLQLIAAAKSGKETSPEALAGWCLLHKPSFRLPEAAENQAMLQFRLLKRLFGFSAQASPQTIPVSGGKEGVAVFDNNPLSMPARIAHLEQNTDQQPEIFISRKNLLEQPLSLRLKFQALFISFRLLLIGGPRVQRALLLYEVFEAAALLRIIQEKRINYLHFYSAFEKDANALTLLLHKFGVHINKLPSPSILAAHHRELITDTLSLGSPYQADELSEYSSTHHIGTVQHFTPEHWPGYGSLYQTAAAAPPQTIGFYSHGVWLREADGHADSGFGDHTAEKMAITALADYLQTRKNIQLIIFLHPRERKPGNEMRTKQHYENLFRGFGYRFSDSSKPSSHQFDAADVGFGGISTILFERLFAARKTVFFPAGVRNFPLAESKISEICPVTPEQLAIVLDKVLNTTANDWFQQSGLSRYTATDWLSKQN